MSRSICFITQVAITIVTIVPLTPAAVAAPTSSQLEASLASIQQVGKQAAGHTEAVAAWRTVGAAEADQLPAILASMNDNNPLACNWIRAAVDSIAERTLAAGKELPIAQLEAHLRDTTHSARSRRLAFEWLTQVDDKARDRWILTFLDDPSLELRREAVAVEIAKAESARESGNSSQAIAAYRTALQHARDTDQIEAASDALKDLNQEVDLPKHFGFITQWQLIAPFDNTDTIGFDTSYPPEEKIEFDAEYSGKGQPARWQPGATEDPYGLVDLNELLGKHKGAVAYAVAFFDSDSERSVDLRLGCINANKIWLNGELLTANHVYHAGSAIDQYKTQGILQKGRNTILLKICQNEQTEDWAQRWEFQFRVCDSLGTAVLSSR